MDTLAFDPLGPRGRRRARLAGAVTIAIILGLVLVAVHRLADTGHLTKGRWLFLADGYNLMGAAGSAAGRLGAW